MSKSPNNRFKILKTVLAILCIVAASVGATLYYATSPWGPLAAHNAVETHGPAVAAPPPAPADVPAPVFLELQPFTVMLHDAQNRRRVLYVAITLRVASEDARALFIEYMPEVRDRILRRLSMQDPITVQTPDGRTLLAQELASALEAPYHPYLSSPRIHNVLFTAFVVQ